MARGWGGEVGGHGAACAAAGALACMQARAAATRLKGATSCTRTHASQVVGTVFGYCSTVMYLMARLSQIIKNWERQ